MLQLHYSPPPFTSHLTPSLNRPSPRPPCQVDDVVAACSMHMCCGMLGLVFIGFFAVPEFVQQLYGPSTMRRAGIFYGGTGHLLACQVGGAVGALLPGQGMLPGGSR